VRDASVRTLFLKTDGHAYQNQPALAAAMGSALAQSQTADPAKAKELSAAYSQMLGTKEGRAFLADPGVNPEARMWAANQVAADPAGTAKMIAGQDKPWESDAVVQAFARPAVERMAATRGNETTRLDGGSDIDNFVGASIGAPITAQPKTEAQATQQQADAAEGKFNYYSGTPTVQKIADGIRQVQDDMGKGTIKVSTVPITFSSQEGGPFSLSLYKVENADGSKSRYVDNTGRTYENFADWKEHNHLPPGKMTYPAEGKLGAPGQTRLETGETPKAQNAGWDTFTRGAALAGAVAGTALIFTGVGSPLGVGLLAVAGTSAAITGVQAGSELYDRSTHGQTLSLADPEARAAWLSLGGSALTLAGVGKVVSVAAREANAAKIGTTVAAAEDAVGIAKGTGAYTANAPWLDEVSNYTKNGTFLQCGNGSCVSATAQNITNGAVTEAQMVKRIGEWSNAESLAKALNASNVNGGGWIGGMVSEANTLKLASNGIIGAELQAPGLAAHMVTIKPIAGLPGQFLVLDTGVGASYTVDSNWIVKYVSKVVAQP